MSSTITALTSGGGLAMAGDTSGQLELKTNNGTTAVTINTSQNVGIGTASPTEKLSVAGAITATGQLIPLSGSTALGYIGNDNSISGGSGSNIGLRAESNMLFATGGSTERMRIDSSGNVAIGDNTSATIKSYVVTTANQVGMYVKASNASQTFGVSQIETARNTTNNTYYALIYYNSGAGADKFRVADSGNVTNTNNSYGAISDVKLKQNIVDATPKLEDLCKVKVRQYNLKSDPDHKQLGVVAQELEEVFAGLVENAPDRDREGNDLGTITKVVKYSVFIPMLIKAIQELNAKVDAQALEIQALKGVA